MGCKPQSIFLNSQERNMVWELWDEIKKNSKARIESKFNLQNQKKG
jgi:hypothetical protein